MGINHVSLIHSSASAHLGYFHLLAVGNHAVRSIDVEMAVQVPAFSSFGDIATRVTADSHGNSMFSCPRTCQKCFPRRAHHHFTFPPALREGSNSSAVSAALGIFFYKIMPIPVDFLPFLGLRSPCGIQLTFPKYECCHMRVFMFCSGDHWLGPSPVRGN